MAEALYRKYRSKSLDEVVGQDHITTTLKNALKTGKISHAYLFSGPRGVGKTSVARILAYNVNDMPYEDPSGLLDIIEIDAASNRRIDEIRELRDKVHVAPAHSKYKVYIIDEVHMLTREAFNALLKTLEEPPKHAIFILATTESHKLPETIVSRTQRFMFKPVSSDEVVTHLDTIAKKEKLQIDTDALHVIATHGEGSFRDSISLLDQVRSLGGPKVTADDIENLLGLPPARLIDDIHTTLLSGEPKDIGQLIDTMRTGGYDAPLIATSLSERIRTNLLGGQTHIRNLPATDVLEKLLFVPASTDPDRYLEIALLEVVLSDVKPAAVQSPAPVAKPQIVTAPTATQPAKPANKTPDKPKPKATKPLGDNELQKLLDDGLWKHVLADIKNHHNTLYSVARMAEVSADDTTLVLAFGFGFHQKRIEESKNMQKLTEVLQKHSGKTVPVRVRVMPKDSNSPTKQTPPKPESDTLGTITEIFGGGELLED